MAYKPPTVGEHYSCRKKVDFSQKRLTPKEQKLLVKLELRYPGCRIPEGYSPALRLNYYLHLASNDSDYSDLD
jgi:hypothetical protein